MCKKSFNWAWPWLSKVTHDFQICFSFNSKQDFAARFFNWIFSFLNFRFWFFKIEFQKIGSMCLGLTERSCSFKGGKCTFLAVSKVRPHAFVNTQKGNWSIVVVILQGRRKVCKYWGVGDNLIFKVEGFASSLAKPVKVSRSRNKIVEP